MDFSRMKEFSRPRYDQNKQRQNKRMFEQKQALQKIGRPSLMLLQGQTLLPPGSRRGFMPESELAVVGRDYNQMNNIQSQGDNPMEQFGGEVNPGGNIAPPSELTNMWWHHIDWIQPPDFTYGDDDTIPPEACDCSCYGAGSTPQGGGCWSGGQPLGPCC